MERATERIQAGDFQSAATLLRRGLEGDPSQVDFWNLLGIAESELNDPAAAETAFLRGLKLAPNSASLNENTGLLYFRRNDFVRTKKYLLRAVQLGSEKPGVLFSLAAARLRTGEAAEAIKELDSLEPALGNVSEYWEERGRAELINDPQRAEVSFNRALDLNPNSIVALNGAATAAEGQHLDEKALAYIIRARAAHPDDVPTLAHFGSVCLRRDLGPDARDALARAHELEPGNNTVLYLLARTNIALENWQQAYDLFQQFSRRVPGFAPAYYAMGWVDVRLDRPADARKQFKQALRLDRTLTGPRYELAQLDLDDGNIDAAEKGLQLVLQQSPRDMKASVALGDIMMRKGKLDDAQRLLQDAIRYDPSLAAAHYKLSLVYARTHQSDLAAKERTAADSLNAEAKRQSKTQLRLVLPEMGSQESNNKK